MQLKSFLPDKNFSISYLKSIKKQEDKQNGVVSASYKERNKNCSYCKSSDSKGYFKVESNLHNVPR